MEILTSRYNREQKGLLHDIADFPISRSDTTGNHTGTWRTLQPVFEEAAAPCSEYCPTHVRIPQFMDFFRKGDLSSALEVIREANPLPAACGRVCPHFCEGECNRGDFDEKINVRSVERFLGDEGLAVAPRKLGETGKGKKAAVVGSGPAGLSAAYFLARHGVAVDMFDREPRPGGMLRYGIPEYRLPKEILDREIENIFSLGVRFTGDREFAAGDVEALADDYDAVFLAPGLWGRNIPGWDYTGTGVHDGLEVLRDIHEGRAPVFGARVAVVGGGNTALDVARVLMRLGRDVTIVYRRTLQESPAFDDEIREALEERIGIQERRLITGIEPREDGCLNISIRGAVEKDGKIVPTGETTEQVVDCVVAATGQVAGMDRPSAEGLYFGGDFESGEGTVVHAVASGKRAALAMLRRMGALSPGESAGAFRTVWEREAPAVIRYDRINPFFFPGYKRLESELRDASKRVRDFGEIVRTPTKDEALEEAGRCFSCGTCTQCGACWYFCPDACVMRGDDDGRMVFRFAVLQRVCHLFRRMPQGLHCNGGGMMARDMMTGSDAVAWGVKLARADVTFAYPITPQTHIVEALSEMAPSWGGRFINVESEFSAIAGCYGAVAAGSRAFTATSSHGLLLMHEVLHWFAGARMPLVLVNANRAVGAPWNIWADQSDSMAQRDTGWLQIYCETCQEALDTVIQGYYVSEKLLLPVMVMIDGFTLSHTMEEVEIRDQDSVDAFLPPYEASFKLDVDDPRSFGNAAVPDLYYNFRKAIQRNFVAAPELLNDCHERFSRIIGARYGLIETYRCEDARTVFLVGGALTGTTRVTVDKMREKGVKAGMIKLRVFRPFPKEALKQAVRGDQSVIVLNRAVSYGAQGTLSQELRSAFYNQKDRPAIYDVIVSLGGKEVFPETLEEVCEGLEKNPGYREEMIWL